MTIIKDDTINGNRDTATGRTAPKLQSEFEGDVLAFVMPAQAEPIVHGSRVTVRTEIHQNGKGEKMYSTRTGRVADLDEWGNADVAFGNGDVAVGVAADDIIAAPWSADQEEYITATFEQAEDITSDFAEADNLKRIGFAGYAWTMSSGRSVTVHDKALREQFADGYQHLVDAHIIDEELVESVDQMIDKAEQRLRNNTDMETLDWAAHYGMVDALKGLLARPYIGTNPRITQEHYDRVTLPWKIVFGKVHPDDND